MFQTTLASAIIEKATRHIAATGDKTALVFFYCDYKDDRTHEPDNIINSLVAQLVMYHEAALEKLLDFYNEFQKPGHAAPNREQPSMVELFRNMSLDFHKVLIVIDGIDECGRKVGAATIEMDSLNKDDASRISTLFLSRHEHEIQHVLHAYHHIPIAARSEDLSLYV